MPDLTNDVQEFLGNKDLPPVKTPFPVGTRIVVTNNYFGRFGVIKKHYPEWHFIRDAVSVLLDGESHTMCFFNNELGQGE